MKDRGKLLGVDGCSLSWLWWWFPGYIFMSKHIKFYHFKYVIFNVNCVLIKIEQKEHWKVYRKKCRFGRSEGFRPQAIFYCLSAEHQKVKFALLFTIEYYSMPLMTRNHWNLEPTSKPFWESVVVWSWKKNSNKVLA